VDFEVATIFSFEWQVESKVASYVEASIFSFRQLSGKPLTLSPRALSSSLLVCKQKEKWKTE
jgi:hypothetical protein